MPRVALYAIVRQTSVRLPHGWFIQNGRR